MRNRSGSKPHALVRGNAAGRVEIVARFKSESLADEAFADVGCYTPPPAPGEYVAVMPLADALQAAAPAAGTA